MRPAARLEGLHAEVAVGRRLSDLPGWLRAVLPHCRRAEVARCEYSEYPTVRGWLRAALPAPLDGCLEHIHPCTTADGSARVLTTSALNQPETKTAHDARAPRGNDTSTLGDRRTRAVHVQRRRYRRSSLSLQFVAWFFFFAVVYVGGGMA